MIVAVAQRSDEWLEERRRGITASECGAVLGLSRYTTVRSLWLLKTKQIQATRCACGFSAHSKCVATDSCCPLFLR